MTGPTVDAIYQRHCATHTAMAAHLPRLRALATDLPLAVEFGVKRGASSSALLMGAQRVISVDLVETPEARALAAAAGDRWDYRIGDARTAAVPPCDLLFLDSLHTYAQLDAELRHAAGQVRRWLVFHDTLTFGSVGANGETGAPIWVATRGESVPIEALGIRPAIDALMIREPSWFLAAHYTDSHGLLVLERRS